MNHFETFVNAVQQGKYDERLSELYVFHNTKEELELARGNVLHVLNGFAQKFPEEKEQAGAVFSGPGRTEIGGNHTDHQHGCVLCGSVNMDALAYAVLNDERVVRIVSEGYPAMEIALDDLSVHEDELNSSAALIRGVAHGVCEKGFAPGGFTAYVTSTVPAGSGLSSSAAYEILVGNIFNHFSCGNALNAVQLAQIGQYAENVYFGKPCGLMDQAASSIGGVVAIDFNDPSAPVIEKVEYDLARSGYTLCIIDTGSCHADLTDDYAGITQEMGGVAAFFDKEVLRDVNEEEFENSIPALRQKLGDRAVLRAMHFFAENKRAQAQAKALKQGDMQQFLELVRESGRSSALLLQNTWSVATPAEQAIPLSIALAEKVLGGEGAVRVHGGGFAGTIQAFVPDERLVEFKAAMEKVLGEGKCHVVSVRPEGGCMVIDSKEA